MDIVERLREYQESWAESIKRMDKEDMGIMTQIRAEQHATWKDAAAEIERLRAKCQAAEDTLAMSVPKFKYEELEAELAEWHKLKDPIALHQNLLRGVPARLTESMKVHLLGEHGVAALMAQQEPKATGCKECDGTGYDYVGEIRVWCPICNNPNDRHKAPPNTEAQQGEPVAWEGAEEWEQLAYELCAEEHGEDACNELLWDGGPIPEPWGERWLKYESEAKRLIALVRKFAPSPNTEALKDALKQARDALWVCNLHNQLHFGETHNTVFQSKEAIAAIDAMLPKE